MIGLVGGVFGLFSMVVWYISHLTSHFFFLTTLAYCLERGAHTHIQTWKNDGREEERRREEKHDHYDYPPALQASLFILWYLFAFGGLGAGLGLS